MRYWIQILWMNSKLTRFKHVLINEWDSIIKEKEVIYNWSVEMSRQIILICHIHYAEIAFRAHKWTTLWKPAVTNNFLFPRTPSLTPRLWKSALPDFMVRRTHEPRCPSAPAWRSVCPFCFAPRPNSPAMGGWRNDSERSSSRETVVLLLAMHR